MLPSSISDKILMKGYPEQSTKTPSKITQDASMCPFQKNLKLGKFGSKSGIRSTEITSPSESHFNSQSVNLESPIGQDTEDMACKTPPGTPPPPYILPIFGVPPLPTEPPQIKARDVDLLLNETKKSPTIQHSIISMEDDDMSDQEVGRMEDHGPFRSLSKLWNHHAHLAVFINYLLSNSDPTSLLFYLITNLYIEGNAKEMKKWAYEIHSTFLVPGAPLRLNNVDENMAREVDEVLMKESDKEEILRKIFWKARTKAKEELNEQLSDFQQKRTAGLGTLFGPSDILLSGDLYDKNRDSKIVEKYLSPKMINYIEDQMHEKNEDERRRLIASSLATVLVKIFLIRTASLDNTPIFVAKEKHNAKAKSNSGKARKQASRGHSFSAQHYFTVTYCNHCQQIIGGICPQGFQCGNCFFNVHEKCIKVNEESCPGPLQRKEKGQDRISKLMDRIRPDKKMPFPFSQLQGDSQKNLSTESDKSTDLNQDNATSLACSDARADNDQKFAIAKPKTSGIIRSESYKEQITTKKKHRQKRKTSDPNISGSNYYYFRKREANETFAEPLDSSSSNSSLSVMSVDSPKVHLDKQHSISVDENIKNPWNSDEDLPGEISWTERVQENFFVNLSDTEKKRQEVINELFTTENSHVKALKILSNVFYKPMLDSQILPLDQMELLFANLDEMLTIHSRFNQSMKELKKKNIFITEIGQLLLDMFDGEAGQVFENAASKYCSKQQIALGTLKDQRSRDPRLHKFLNDIEANPVCKRLQLKDHILTGMLRLTKYPLLFENLSKYSPETDAQEKAAVARSLERSKEILCKVNQAVREAENHHRLIEIQKVINTSMSADKVQLADKLIEELKKVDFTNRRLIHEGALQWRVEKGKMVDLHVVLLDNSILFLHRTDDEKFDIRFINQVNAVMLSPILRLSTILVRHNAVEKDSLYLINTSPNGAQIYDLVAPSPLEKKQWYDNILRASETFQVQKKPLMQCLTSFSFNNMNKEPTDAPPQNFLDKEILLKTEDNHYEEIPEVDGSADVGTGENGIKNYKMTEYECPNTISDQNITKLESIIDILNVIEPFKTDVSKPLNDTCNIKVEQQKIYLARAVTTPLEHLRRIDEVIKQNVLKKNCIVNNILDVLSLNNDSQPEKYDDLSNEKSSATIVADSIAQINQLMELLNQTLNLYEEDAIVASQNLTSPSDQSSDVRSTTDQVIKYKEPMVPVSAIMPVCHYLLADCSQLLRIILDNSERQKNLRNELKVVRERLHSIIDNQQTTRTPQLSEFSSEATDQNQNPCNPEDTSVDSEVAKY